MRKEYLCDECDLHFTINLPRGYEVKFCPHCGTEIQDADFNEFEED